jgi:signal transduction histidine kinase
MVLFKLLCEYVKKIYNFVGMKNNILIIILFLATICMAQSKSKAEIIILNNKIVTAKSQEAKVDAINELGLYWYNHNYDSATYYFKKAYSISKKIKYNKGLFEYALSMGDVYSYQGKPEENKKLMLEALKLAKAIKDKHREALFTANLGGAYANCDEFEQAIQYYQESIKLFEANNEPDYVRKLNYGTGFCFYNSDNFNKSIEYGNRGYLLAQKANDSVIMCLSTALIGKSYCAKEEFQMAKPYVEKALLLANKLKIDVEINDAQLYISQILFSENKINEAIYWGAKSLAFYEKTGNVYDRVNCLAHLSKCYLKHGEKTKALKSIQKAVSFNSKTQRLYVYQILSEVNFELGNYKDAYLYFEKRNVIRDSINASKLQFNMQQLDAKFKSAEKDNDILLLEKQQTKQKTFIYSLSAIALGLLLFSFLLYRNYSARRKISEQEITQLQQEKKIDAAHNMIQGEETERTRLARDLHDGLGGMLSGVKFQLNSMKGNVILSEENAETFTRSISQLDNAITEMRRVAHNMMPEALLKFGLNDTLKDYCESVSQNSGLAVTFQSFGLEKRLDQSTEIVLYRIVQELLNNTVKHANATQTQVQFSRIGNVISLTVEDNGKGFDINNLEKNGIGISNIQNRVDYLNGKMDIKSDEKGTSTHIEFELA